MEEKGQFSMTSHSGTDRTLQPRRRNEDLLSQGGTRPNKFVFEER